jgi:Uma2 family endonuclease
VTSVLILDPYFAKRFRAEHEANGNTRFDEVWEGMLVVPPLPNNEHQEMQLALCIPFYDLVTSTGLGQVLPGANVSDRAVDWTTNYRGPDLVVYLNSNPAINHGTHWEGGPDFLVEIVSPGEDPHAKFDFYSKINSREVLIVNRNPWALELHQLRNGRLEPAGTSDPSNPAVLSSSVVPFTFRLIPGQPRPKIELVHPPTGRRWEA